MFKEETLFILGAGASCPYNYPTGKDLIKNIIQNIKKDSIYLPKTNNVLSKYYWNDNSGIIQNDKLFDGYQFNDFIDSLKSISISEFTNPSKFVNSGNDFSIGNSRYQEVKLYQIDDFFNLKKALIDFDPVSIDSFLRDHPSYTVAGKIMIIYSLLKCEDKNRFTHEDRGESADNWYSFFINDILSGCNNPNDITNNKLNIITFNYDLSLDYCLYKKLSNIELFKKNTAVQNFISDLIKTKINHVYGQLYDDNLLDYGEFYITNETKNPHDINMKRFLKAIQCMDLIKSIHQERIKTTKYQLLIKEAKEIIIIGFGFDRDNLTMLGFPEKIVEYYKFLKGKKLKYLDFKGQMNSLHDQFSAVVNFSKHRRGAKDEFIITRSIATSIISAYQNDFKIYLYQD